MVKRFCRKQGRIQVFGGDPEFRANGDEVKNPAGIPGFCPVSFSYISKAVSWGRYGYKFRKIFRWNTSGFQVCDH
jgi:hypothetical protein